MNATKAAIAIALACLCAGAQTPEVRPQIAGRPVQEGQVTVVYLAPRFATAIRAFSWPNTLAAHAEVFDGQLLRV